MELRIRTAALRTDGCIPQLVVLIIGEDSASVAYTKSLTTAGSSVGVDVTVVAVPADTDEAGVRARLERLGDDADVHGIILQQPLPSHLAIRRIADAMPPHKDVDGANPINQGRLAFGSGTDFVPATPAAVMLLIERSPHRELRGVPTCVVGRSNVVGLPVTLLLMAADATVTSTHRFTRDLAHHTRQADVLVVAAGVPGLVRGDMVRRGATVIDVGTTLIGTTLVGDLDYAGVAAIAGAVTPVPGGVGPVTNLALMRNVVSAAERIRRSTAVSSG